MSPEKVGTNNNDINCLGVIGGKASNLIALKGFGFNVPKFSCINSSHFVDFLLTGKLSEETLKQVAEVCNDLKFPVAVRSSANIEDGIDNSFAGMFSTYLNLNSVKEVIDAIEKVWQETFSIEVKGYCSSHGLEIDSLQMAVIIQEMVAADYAGVCFTVNPMTGVDTEVVIEACAGLGDRLVSGVITPDRYTVSWDNNLKTKSTLVSEDLILHLAKQGRELQAKFGQPQDIEFAITGSNIYFLQSRPVTAINYAYNLGLWTTSDLRDGGVSSGAGSPMMMSMYSRILNQSMPSYLNEMGLVSQSKADQIQWAKVFYGRLFWNLGAVKSAFSKLPGYVESHFDKDLSVEPVYEGEGVVTPTNIVTIAKATPTIVKFPNMVNRQIKTNKKIIKKCSDWENRYMSVDYSLLNLQEVFSFYKEIYSEVFPNVERNYFKTIYLTSSLRLDFKSKVEGLAKNGTEINVNRLISQLKPLKVMEPNDRLLGLAKLVENKEAVITILKRVIVGKESIDKQISFNSEMSFWQGLKVFLHDYYFHSTRELDIRVPRWSEDSSFVCQILISLLSQGEWSHSKIDLKGQETDHLIQAIKRRPVLGVFPRSTRSWLRSLELLREMTWLREEMRDCSTRVYFWVRKCVLEVAKRLDWNEDIFNLKDFQLLDLVEGRVTLAQAKEFAFENKKYCDGFLKYKAPNEIGSPWSGKKKVSRKNQENQMLGIGASQGVVTGTARVLKSLNQVNEFTSGEILIAPYTDPGWTPLFSLASAVVTENGGLLSHAALVSREFQLPAVLAISDATEVIKTGDRLRVDGGLGTVEIIGKKCR